jgi:hypothetical protein
VAQKHREAVEPLNGVRRRRSLRHLAILVSLVLLSLTGSACFDSSTPRPSVPSRTEQTALTAGPDTLSGLLKGRATLIGGPCIYPRPLKNGVFALRSHGHVVATVTTDTRGRFSCYRIMTIRGARYVFRPRMIRVSADRATRVALQFGI